MENAPRRCFLCSREIEAGTRAAFVTIKAERADRVYHLSCFEACTTGSRELDIWAYRIGDMPAKER
jgi:hypothetical protein